MEINKIYCMDCLEGLKQLPDSSVDLIITDPPYPIDRDNGTNRLFCDHPQEKEWFKEGYDEWLPFLFNFLKEMKRILVEGNHLYIFTNEANLLSMKAICDGFFNFKSILVWHKATGNKESYGMGYHYRKSCEYVILYSKGTSKRHIVDHGTLLHYPRNQYDINHPTPKPVGMCRLFIEKSTIKDEIVLDPFMGSGTTALAAKQLGRRFIGFEIDQKYVDMSNERLKQDCLSILQT